MMQLPLWINGAGIEAATRQTVRVPYDGAPVAEVQRATPKEVNDAVSAARTAAALMREATREERSSILRRAHQLLLERRDQFAAAISNESGKPIKEARIEVERAASTLLFSSEEAHRLAGEVVPIDASATGKGRWGMTVREPVGVIAAITPFNFPLNLAMHKIGPAIAGGNTIVHKPASSTPVSAILMAQLFAECGLPAGALNVITGPGGEIGDALAFHPDVAMVTFTGSAEVGLRIRNLAGMKKVTLELGNNSAVIVERDANLAEAAVRCVQGAFAHSGQVCISVQRVYVHSDIRDEFVERMVDATRKLVIGPPSEPSTDVSSLITEKEAERVEEWIGEAERAGAKKITGGNRRHATVEPAILAEAPDDAKVSSREAFGPLVVVNRYADLQEAIARVNASEYGLQAGIYTRDLEKAFRAARQVHVGGFLINEVPQWRADQMPYGGVKMSGTGREGPRYAIEEMTEPKLIVWKV